MANKPAHLHFIDGREPRQIVWNALRALSAGDKPFTTYTVARKSDQDDETVRDYLRALARACVVEHVRPLPNRNAEWRLIKDEGAEAPRVNKAGERLPPDAVECIWRGLRILGSLTAAEAVKQATAGGAQIGENAAGRYLSALHKAGYVTREQARPALYRLRPGFNTGPLHPIHQRRVVEQIYDPNKAAVTWTTEASQ